MSNPLPEIFEQKAIMKAEDFAGEVWEFLSAKEKAFVLEVARLVVRKELALDGII